MLDIYFEPHYGELYEKIENGVNTVFKYSSSYGKIYHMFIKREIEIKIDDEIWYDLVTPYGYGGPIIIECKEGKRDILIEEFNKSFSQYCMENNVVSEFIRFHPIIGNANDFRNMYEVSYVRNTVGTKICPNEDPIQTEFSKSARKSIQRALKFGLTYRITYKPECIDNFIEIYYSTMERNNAEKYYYFGQDYFNECLQYFKNNILFIEVIYENKVIAAALYFVYGKFIHAHLSGTLKEYLMFSPAYVIKYATALWAKENGISLIHYGGGITDSKEDALYKYKKKFTRNTEFEFYIGKKIWNNQIYEKLCELSNVDRNIQYFPAYRKR